MSEVNAQETQQAPSPELLRMVVEHATPTQFRVWSMAQRCVNEDINNRKVTARTVLRWHILEGLRRLWSEVAGPVFALDKRVPHAADPRPQLFPGIPEVLGDYFAIIEDEFRLDLFEKVLGYYFPESVPVDEGLELESAVHWQATRLEVLFLLADSPSIPEAARAVLRGAQGQLPAIKADLTALSTEWAWVTVVESALAEAPAGVNAEMVARLDARAAAFHAFRKGGAS